MDTRPLTDPAELDRLLATQPLNPFLQSWSWGDFQAAVGRKIWRLGAWEHNQLVGAALVIQHQLMLGQSYLYCPRGPLAQSMEALSSLLTAIKDLGQENGAMYVKADLGKYRFAINESKWPDFTAGTTLQPRQTLLIEVSKPPSELLSAMHQKTRYNIRLAEKRGVEVRWSTSDADFESFLELMHATYARQSIRLHSDEYYRTLFTTLKQNNLCDIGIAEYKNTILAANLMIWCHNTATYLHGGSAEVFKDVMAPHLLQWKTIERSHTQGMTEYDLWGIAPENQPQHKWSGVTRFKKGLGGRVEVFPSAVNAVLQPQWYLAYRFAKRIRGGVDE